MFRDEDGPLPDHHYPEPPLLEFEVIYRDSEGKVRVQTVKACYPDSICHISVYDQHPNFAYRSIRQVQEGK